jgi:hypothetical protein
MLSTKFVPEIQRAKDNFVDVIKNVQSQTFEQSRPKARATKLVEFSPIRRLFTMGVFPKLTEVARNFGAAFVSR